MIKEIGFWDYTCPGHGSLEYYTRADWDVLLDDMAAGGFNSLVLAVKWMTTGYRSRLPWLDQDASVAAIASDNATLHYALDGARRRGIKTWLLVVASIYHVASFGMAPAASSGEGLMGCAAYDIDQPGLPERILELFGEVAELFGAQADGVVIELEHCDGEAPHRVALYDAWAAANGRPSFAQIKAAPLESRAYPLWDWRDFTTSRRIERYREIAEAMRARGYNGRFATLVEMANAPGVVALNQNLAMLRDALPDWPIVTYDSIYDRRVNRLATMDFCVEQPHANGLEALYLTRGVMTWTWPPDGPALDLPEQWRLAIEDAARHRPDALWFMGSDARSNGLVCSDVKLPQWGCRDGRSARLQLMEMVQKAIADCRVRIAD